MAKNEYIDLFVACLIEISVESASQRGEEWTGLSRKEEKIFDEIWALREDEEVE